MERPRYLSSVVYARPSEASRKRTERAPLRWGAWLGVPRKRQRSYPTVPARLQLDDAALQRDHHRVCAIVCAQFREDVLDVALDRVFGR
jgi:hypothetical protein